MHHPSAIARIARIAAPPQGRSAFAAAATITTTTTTTTPTRVRTRVFI